jgi:transcriptional regulator with XRE-family HTH domain
MRERDQIKLVRKNANLTQEALARKIGVTKACISNIESGYATPSASILKKIEEALNVKFDIPLYKKLAIFAIGEPSDAEVLKFCARTISAHTVSSRTTSSHTIATQGVNS